MNLDNLLDDFLGEGKETEMCENECNACIWNQGYNQALQDLKSRKQELIEEIEKWATEKFIAQRLKELK